jgi:hypothetical protein
VSDTVTKLALELEFFDTRTDESPVATASLFRRLPELFQQLVSCQEVGRIFSAR